MQVHMQGYSECPQISRGSENSYAILGGIVPYIWSGRTHCQNVSYLLLPEVMLSIFNRVAAQNNMGVRKALDIMYLGDG